MTLCFLCALHSMMAAAVSLFLSLSPHIQQIRSGTIPEDVLSELAGCSDISELDADQYEHWCNLFNNPLNVNCASRAELASTELFSEYQIETLIDYRNRCGDILSVGELAVINGFSRDNVRLFAPFLSFESVGNRRVDGRGAVSVTNVGVAWKQSEGKDNFQYLVGENLYVGNFNVAASCKSEWLTRAAFPKIPSISLSCRNIRRLSILTLGNFNARFAQGVAQWSGNRIGAETTPSSLMRHPSGITPYTSYSPQYAMFGAAATMEVHSFSISPYIDIGGLDGIGGHSIISRGSAGFNGSWHHRNGTVGMTVVAPFAAFVKRRHLSASVDFQHTVRGTVAFAEIASGFCRDSLLSAVCGVRCATGPVDCSVRLSSDMTEQNVTAAAAWNSDDRIHFADVSVLFSYYSRDKGLAPKGKAQLKFYAEYSFSALEQWNFKTLFKGRMRPWGDGNSLSLRQDMMWTDGRWSANARVESVLCKSLSFAAFAEAGYKDSRNVTVWMQCGAFVVDNWADRVYVYRRDVPQSFNIPALYGRGCWLSSYAVMTPSRCVKIFFSASYTAYPWARQGDKHTKDHTEVKLQCVLTF